VQNMGDVIHTRLVDDDHAVRKYLCQEQYSIDVLNDFPYTAPRKRGYSTFLLKLKVWQFPGRISRS
ncbi:MAG: hypothetical protein KA957_10450, partial [Syntrophaceae bacterium]|nr:hypothetical protein [Syntrophaceae bacterium]